MPHNHEWQSRMKAVEREYLAMRQAADRFRDEARRDPTILEHLLQHREVVRASERLEDTYIIRLFAEFEAGARHYWKKNWPSRPKTADLLNGLAARRGIPDTQRENAHTIRNYRNALVHGGQVDKEKRPYIGDCRQHLCWFFSFLPFEW